MDSGKQWNLEQNYNLALREKAALKTEIEKIKRMNHVLADEIKSLEMELRVLNLKTAGVYGYGSRKPTRRKSIYR